MTIYRDNANPPAAPRHFTPEVRLPIDNANAEPRSFKTRDQFPELMSQWGLNGVGVEVGVYRGGFSTHILRNWPGVLHLVDPWEYQPDKRDLLNTPDAPDNERITRMAMQDYVAEGRCVIHKGYSADMASRFRGGPMGTTDGVLRPFDWVYIDALHDYQSCLDDMRAWAPLIRSGGALCGHDYLEHKTEPDTQTEFGVVSAVRDWCAENGYQVKRDVLLTTHDGYPTWCIRLR